MLAHGIGEHQGWGDTDSDTEQCNKVIFATTHAGWRSWGDGPDGAVAKLEQVGGSEGHCPDRPRDRVIPPRGEQNATMERQ